MSSRKRKLDNPDDIDDVTTLPAKKRRLPTKNDKDIKLIKSYFNFYNDYNPEYCITMFNDYESKEKYSKKTLFKTLANVDWNIKIKSILRLICELAEGRIVSCAECNKFELNIRCDAQVDQGYKSSYYNIERAGYMHSVVLKDEQINDMDINEIETIKQDLENIVEGMTYIVICSNCRNKNYCLSMSCMKRCFHFDCNDLKEKMQIGTKICEECKGAFCSHCNYNWEPWDFADSNKVCTSCGWVIKNNV